MASTRMASITATQLLLKRPAKLSRAFNCLVVQHESPSVAIRGLHTTRHLLGSPQGDDPIKNFDGFKWPNQVTTFEHYKLPQELLDHEFNYPVCRDTMGIRWPGYWFKRKFVYVQEMEPELVVPDLEGFNLKPYVSYRAEDIETPPLTARELFNQVYADGVSQAFHEHNIEELTVTQDDTDKARLRAMQTGADLFEDYTVDGVRASLDYAED